MGDARKNAKQERRQWQNDEEEEDGTRKRNETGIQVPSFSRALLSEFTILSYHMS